ncbi:hypothetical protein SHA53_003152 [Salmonella enterica]|nr:hypothetical protein [Salmonella enterica]
MIMHTINLHQVVMVFRPSTGQRQRSLYLPAPLRMVRTHFLPASPLTLVLMDMEEHTFSTPLVRTGE